MDAARVEWDVIDKLINTDARVSDVRAVCVHTIKKGIKNNNLSNHVHTSAL